jgi:hypothetical protein
MSNETQTIDPEAIPEHFRAEWPRSVVQEQAEAGTLGRDTTPAPTRRAAERASAPLSVTVTPAAGETVQ